LVPSVLAIEKLQKHFHIGILNIYFRSLAKSLQKKRAFKKVPTVWKRGSLHRFPKASFGLCCNRKRNAAAAILLLGFFIDAFPTIVFAGHFTAREVAPVEVARELETEIMHQQWSLNKTAPESM